MSYKKNCPENFWDIHRKTPVLDKDEDFRTVGRLTFYMHT